MSIKASKNNEPMPDFNDMMNEVNHDMERQDLEQGIVERVPDLRRLSDDIDRSTTAVINAKLSLERAIDQTDKTERRLDASVTTISGKVDTINEHIDNVMKDTPTKLQVYVSVSDPDMKKIQDMFDKEHEWVTTQMQTHLKRVNNMFLDERRKIMQRYKEYDGCYLGPRLQWFVWSFFFIGISVVVGSIAMLVALYCCK